LSWNLEKKGVCRVKARKRAGSSDRLEEAGQATEGDRQEKGGGEKETDQRSSKKKGSKKKTGEKDVSEGGNDFEEPSAVRGKRSNGGRIKKREGEGDFYHQKRGGRGIEKKSSRRAKGIRDMKGKPPFRGALIRDAKSEKGRIPKERKRKIGLGLEGDALWSVEASRLEGRTEKALICQKLCTEEKEKPNGTKKTISRKKGTGDSGPG